MKHHWWIWLIFFLSGFAALVYQIVWMRMLTPILGCTVYATATVVAGFMLGFAVGSHLLGRWIDHRDDPLYWYSLLEFGIAGSAVVLSCAFGWLMPIYRAAWQLAGGTGWITVAVRFAFVFAILLVPTTLMGGTLPVMTRFLNREAKTFGRYLGWLYGVNTLGAVFGSLASGFVLIAWLGQRSTVLLGVGLNLLVGFIAWQMHRRVPRSAVVHAEEPEAISGYGPAIRRLALVCFMLSGSTALAYEVIWTRWLQLLVGTSVYAFTIILVVFLIGIALGSATIGRWSDRLRNPLAWFGGTQIFVALWAVIAMWLFAPLELLDRSMFAAVLAGSKTAVLMILPITLAFGWLFPIASRCCARTVREVGASVGTAYAMNTIGCTLGSLAAGFVLLPLLGSARSLVVVSVFNVLLGMVLLACGSRGRLRGWTVTGCGVALVLLGALFLIVPHRDPYLNAIRATYLKDDTWRIYSHVETADATVTAFGPTSENADAKRKQLLVNGIGMTLLTTDTKLMAHLPLLMVPDPKRMLVVCFGMGTTLRSASRYDGLEVTGVELVDSVVSMFPYFHQDADEVLSRPGVRVAIDDGRNFLLMHDERWDVITIDPAPPIYSAGTVNLYTKEFLSLCRDHLTSDGAVCLWVPPWAETEILMILRTFFDVFPDATLWSGSRPPGFYLIGGRRRLTIDEARVRSIYDNPMLRADLTEWDSSVATPERLLARRICGPEGLAFLTSQAAVITDDRPYTEFPLWRYLGNRSSRHFNAREAHRRLAMTDLSQKSENAAVRLSDSATGGRLVSDE